MRGWAFNFFVIFVLLTESDHLGESKFVCQPFLLFIFMLSKHYEIIIINILSRSEFEEIAMATSEDFDTVLLTLLSCSMVTGVRERENMAGLGEGGRATLRRCQRQAMSVLLLKWLLVVGQ